MHDKEDKQHEATSKHLDDLRSRGQSLRSKDISGGLLLIATIIILLFLSDKMVSRIELNFIQSYRSISDIISSPVVITSLLHSLIINTFITLIPIYIFLLITAYGSVFLLGGWNFSLKSVGFKLDKLNFFQNLSNIFSKKIVIEVFKSFAKFSLLAICFFIFLNKNLHDILLISGSNVDYSFISLGSFLKKYLLILLVGIIVIMLIDGCYSYFSYYESVKMTHQEVKDELKETEGNSEVKRKLKSLQYALLKQRIPQKVPLATVVITNPTHYSVALCYVSGRDKAPKLLAKGKNLMAKEIRKIAISHSIPIYEEPILARAIYHTTKIDGFINQELYLATAIVLGYIHQLKQYQRGLAPYPVKSKEIKVPDHLQFKN